MSLRPRETDPDYKLQHQFLTGCLKLPVNASANSELTRGQTTSNNNKKINSEAKVKEGENVGLKNGEPSLSQNGFVTGVQLSNNGLFASF